MPQERSPSPPISEVKGTPWAGTPASRASTASAASASRSKLGEVGDDLVRPQQPRGAGADLELPGARPPPSASRTAPKLSRERLGSGADVELPGGPARGSRRFDAGERQLSQSSEGERAFQARSSSRRLAPPGPIPR